ncbi:amino acid ABC transporter permease [Burkholderia gladioli]|uniref:amino acid ABC transporter permease n=1 Tax=Burkholderia gladioli TaxID=28095 RepID=UPI00039F83BA|nr:amino acid ABC transporter permease [Burkholderia gladioli]NHH83868.1 Arginine transport system permease protein ArtQ [Burkholderia gladioli]
MELFIDNFLSLDSLRQIYPLLLQGLKWTLLLSLVAAPASIALGMLIAIGYSFHHRVANLVLIAYIDLFRSFPVVVLLALIYYGLPFFGITLSSFAAVVLALALNNSGYYGEIFRAGIESVPHGQREAARSLGFGRSREIAYIVLPQAVRNVLAPLASNTLELFKSTSIASLVSLPELLRSSRVAQEQTYNPTPLMAAAVIFFLLLWPLARWVARLERQALSRR